MEYESDVEEERERVQALLENLRIEAEILVFWLASGSLETYEIIVNGKSPSPEAEQEVEECLESQEWWEEIQKIRGNRGEPSPNEEDHVDVESILGSSAWPDASFQQGPRHEKVERFLGLRRLLHKSRRRRTISEFSKLGVNLGMRAQRLPPQLTKLSGSEHNDSDSDSSSDDSDAVASDDAESLSAASEADAADFESDSDDPLFIPAKLIRRRSHGDAIRGPPPSKKSTGEREPSITKKKKKTAVSNISTPARSFKESDLSSAGRQSSHSSGATSFKEPSYDIKPLPATPSKAQHPPKLEERFSALRESPTIAPLSPTKTTHLGSASERPILSRHASSQKFSSRTLPKAQIATEEGAGPSIMFIDTPLSQSRRNRLPSAYRPQDHSSGTAPASSADKSDSPLSSPPSIPHRGSAYSTQSLPLSFNDLPCRAQHLVLNELMRQNSKDTAVMFTTLPSPVQGTHKEEAACVAYLSDLEVLGRGCPPTLMVHSNSMTVTMSL